MRGRGWIALAAVAVVLAIGAGVVFTLGGTPLWRRPAATPPSAVRTSSPVVLPSPSSPSLPPTPGSAAPLPEVGGVRRALDPLARVPALGGDVAGSVLDAATGAVLYARHATSPLLPASTAKLATATAALAVLGADHVLTTSVVAGAPGSVILVGGGDPTLASPGGAAGYPGAASLDVLAARTAAALRASGTGRVNLGYDASRFTGSPTGPGWKPSYVTGGDVAPVSALEVDEGRLTPGRPARTPDPAAAAAAAFAARLAVHGIRVLGAPAPAAAPADAGRLASVVSPPVAGLVERMLQSSDNDLAEALARQVAVARGLPGSFAGGAKAVSDVLTGLGIGGFRLVDGSGLSRLDRVSVAALTALLRVDLSRPELHDVLTGLPVAGFAGTLADRYQRGGAHGAAGDVRAKTGTLAQVSSLAGITVDDSGRLLVFAFISNAVPSPDPSAAEAALDALAAALTRCGCTAAPPSTP